MNTLFPISNEQIITYKTTLDDLLLTQKNLSKANYEYEKLKSGYNELTIQFYTLKERNEKLEEEKKNLNNKLEILEKEKENFEKIKNENILYEEKMNTLKEEYKKSLNSIKNTIELNYKNNIESETDKKYTILEQKKIWK